MANDVPVTDLVRTTVEAGMARITIDRADAGSSRTAEMRDHLADTFEELSIAMTKWLVNRSSESSRHSAFEEEAYAQELVTATADMAEGIRAFGERRSPEFKGW